MRLSSRPLGDSEEYDKPYGLRNLVGDVVHYAAPYRFTFIAAAFLRLTSDLVWLYPAWALGQITTFLAGYRPGQPMGYFWLLLFGWLAAGVYRYTVLEISKYQGFKLSEKMGLDAKMEGIRHLFKLDILWHEREYAGSKLKRIANGADSLTQVVRMIFLNLIEASVSIIGISLILYSLSVELSVGILVFVFSYYFISFTLTRKVSKQSRIVSERQENLEGMSFESVSNIYTVKTMDISGPIMAGIDDSGRSLFEELRKRILFYRVREAIVNNYALIFQMAFLAYIGNGIYQGRFEIGLLVMFYTYFNRIFTATTEMSTVTNELLIEMIMVGRLRSLLDVKPTIEVEGKRKMPADWRQLSVKNLSFAYGGKYVLKDVNFTVRRCERVGIVGPSGAGKSTLFKLLLKLHENYEGEILVDGVPLKDIDRSSYMESIAVVLQETEVFNMSLKNNIKITGGDESNLDRSVNTANLDEALDRMPSGLDSIIGEKGVRLSGGEKQRLGIARAVYKDPDILFLDEATSNLDANSEGKIQEALRRVFKDVTAIVIAHRLSTIREMDRIIVFDLGMIVEEGTFKELTTKEGLFFDLWQKQKL